MKRFICIALILVTIFSLASCSCFKQGPLEEKYTYKKFNEKYIDLVDYKNHTVEVPLDAIQAAVDTYLMNNAAEYTAARGDDIYVDIDVYAESRYTSEDGDEKVFKGDKIDELSLANYLIKDLGSSPLPHKIETELINANLKISNIMKRTFKYEELEDYCTNLVPNAEEKYAGKNFYFEIKIMDKVIEEGDVVDVSFAGYRTDENGEKLSDQKFSESTGEKFFIGSKLAIDDFENGLIGATVGEEFSFKATFPDDYANNEELKGQTVIFDATVKSVYTPPVYNDDFVKALFPDYGTISAFEESLKKDFIMNEMFIYVSDETEILKYPKAEYRDMENSIKDSDASFKEYYGYTFDEYLKNRYNMTRDEYIKSQMKTEMIYYAIAKREGIEPTPEMITNEKTNLITYYKEINITQNKLSSSEALKAAEELVGNLGEVYIYENVLFNMIKEFLYKTANAVEIPKTFTSISQKIANKGSETK